MNTPFEFHIGDMRSGRAEPRDISAEVSVDWHVELSRVLPQPPLFFDLELAPIPGGISVLGAVEASVMHRCHRCLTEWVEEIGHEVAQMIAIEGDEDDDYRLEGDVFDFEPMIRDELMLSLPIAPQCGPDCEGLVVGGGTDLNTDLSEDEVASSSPFSVLKDLLEDGD